jgi:hypothetical protein
MEEGGVHSAAHNLHKPGWSKAERGLADRTIQRE